MDVSNTSCGACSVCCTALTFDLGSFRKLSGVACPHCKASGGCGVYETRWEVCRTYYCGYRHLGLPEDWRPDKSGLLISLRDGPNGEPNGIDFELVGPHERLAWMPFIKFLAALIDDNTPVYLSLPGEPGYQTPWVYLNDMPALKDGIARRDLALTKTALTAALQICLDTPKTKIP